MAEQLQIIVLKNMTYSRVAWKLIEFWQSFKQKYYKITYAKLNIKVNIYVAWENKLQQITDLKIWKTTKPSHGSKKY